MVTLVMSDDTYTGAVQVGGPVDVRHLPGLTIAKVAVGPMSNNAYLLRCTATGEGLLIDAANEAPGCASSCSSTGRRCRRSSPRTGTPTTGRRCAALTDFAGAAVYAGEPDADELPVAVDERLEHGDEMTVGDVSLEVIALRGHTPGSVAVLYRDPEGIPHLFTGDSLFPGGVGKTWSAEDFVTLLDDVERADLRPAAGRNLVLPGPRRRLHARRGTPAPRRMARARLVAAPDNCHRESRR